MPESGGRGRDTSFLLPTDRLYDYRYSVLLDVFGQLVREGRLKTEELNDLAEDKLAYIHTYPG